MRTKGRSEFRKAFKIYFEYLYLLKDLCVNERPCPVRASTFAYVDL